MSEASSSPATRSTVRAREILRLLQQHGEHEAFELFIRELCHDLRTPLSTVSLELYSADFLSERASKEIDSGERQAAQTSVQEMGSVHANMARAARAAESILAALQQVLTEE